MEEHDNDLTGLAIENSAAAAAAAREAAIAEYLAEGYVDDAGQRRPVHSRSHAEFLARAGTITLPN